MNEFHEVLSDVLEEHYQTLINKNSNYGDNLLYFGLRGVLIRLHDKYKRLETLVLKEDPDLVGESIADTLRDLSGYCLVALTHLEMGDMTVRGVWGQNADALSTWEKNS